MGYPLQQLQQAAHYIVNQCEHHNGDKLTKGSKKWAYRELLSALSFLKQDDPIHIIIHSNNTKLSAFFKVMDQDKISLPDNITFILKRNGVCEEKIVRRALGFHEQVDMFSKIMTVACKSKEGKELSEGDKQKTYQLFTKSLHEARDSKATQIEVSAQNQALESLFSKLYCEGIIFPKNKSYTLKNDGKCIERHKSHATLLFGPCTTRRVFYDWAQERHRSKGRGKSSARRARLSTLLDDDSESYEFDSMLTAKFADCVLFDELKTQPSKMGLTQSGETPTALKDIKKYRTN